MRLFFKAFDSKMASREKLFKAAVEYANQLGRERILTLSHSEDRDNIVITIWYWAEEEIKPQELKKAAALAARAAHPRPPVPPGELTGLSGGFAALSRPPERESEDTLTRTPTLPPNPMDQSMP